MRMLRFSLPLVLVLFLGLSIPLTAQSDSQFMGILSQPFTTLVTRGELVHPGELDWYRFDVEGSVVTVFILVDSEEGTRTLLFDSDENYIDTANAGFLEVVLQPGSYYVRIDSVESGIQDYALVLVNGIETESNEGIVESNNLGLVVGPIKLYASIMPVGDADFYRFQIPETGLAEEANALLITTDGPASGDTAMVLYLFDEDADRYLPIAVDDDSGESYWSQLLVLPQKGESYALRVEETAFPLEGIDAYGLTITPVALVIDAEPNNTAAQATQLEPLDDTAAWMTQGMLDANDTIDFYSLTIESAALFQFQTEAQDSAGVYDTLLALYTEDGTLLADSDDSGDSGWSRFALSLEAGDYIVTVEMDSYSTPPLPYRLMVTATPVRVLSETEPNDTDETSEVVEWVAGSSLLIDAAIGIEGDVDSFKIVITEAANVTFETGARNGSSADTTLAIYDEDLWQIGYNDDANGSWSRVEQELPAGTYYVVIESYFSDETFDYSLLITANPVLGSPES